MDIILGNFASHYIYLLSSEDIDKYETIVSTNDHQLYKYIIGQDPIPQYLDNSIMKNIISFNESLVRSKLLA